MEIVVRNYVDTDVPEMIELWNDVVADGTAFPQEDLLDCESGKTFFKAQTYCGVAQDKVSGKILGLYILHPNNVGRCGHISNASFAVDKGLRGRRIGETLVKHCLKTAKDCGFGILQFNAVVVSNIYARRLYEKLGFVRLGVVPDGFRMKDGHYEDICLYYHVL